MESTALRLGERDAREREVFLNARTPTSTQLATYRTYVGLQQISIMPSAAREIRAGERKVSG